MHANNNFRISELSFTLLPSLSSSSQMTSSRASPLGLDIGLVTANMLLKLEQLRGELDLLLQEVLSIQLVFRGVASVLLDVQTDCGSRGTSARKADNNSATRGETGIQALVGGHGTIKVRVGEVASLGDSATWGC